MAKHQKGVIKVGFYNAMRQTALESDTNVARTENGALGYRTTGKELLDLNFAVASLRSASDDEIIRKFMAAYNEDRVLAIKWLFFARDVRGGLGERRLFRCVIKYLSYFYPALIDDLIPWIAEYGRYDDLWCLLDNDSVSRTVISMIIQQYHKDLDNYAHNRPISLLAKWLPSPNASSAETKRYARIIRKGLGLSERDYRKTLSKLRGYLKIVEQKMSAKKWHEINYETVPSRANLIYSHAFLRNDTSRRVAYLSAVQKGTAKINSSVLYPHDIVYKYRGCGYSFHIVRMDDALEAMWDALPDVVNGCGNTIVVADGSGSMRCNVVGGRGVTALDVANALAIYFAERSSGEFKNKYITFSARPQFVDFSRADTLRDKLNIALEHRECTNTNLEAVFELILHTAIKNRMAQEDLPANILIISDMEFDCGCSYEERLFDEIGKKYADAGYKVPRLVFWNVNSRTGTIPVRENELGVALVSGFSPNICKMVMSGETDPYECLLDTLSGERYDPISEIVERRMRNAC